MNPNTLLDPDNMNSAEVSEQIQRLNSRVAALEAGSKASRFLFTQETAPLMRASLHNRNFTEVNDLLSCGFDPSYPLTFVLPT